MPSQEQIFSSPQQFREILYGFQTSRVILTAYELDLFTVVDNKTLNSNQVAQALNTHPRATNRLMNALVAIGLLNKSNNEFTNTPFAETFLSKNSDKYLKGFMHTTNMWHSWTNLTNVVKTGKTQHSRLKTPRNDNWAEAFIAAMHERGLLNAQEVINHIDLKNTHSFLDIGGGSGVYAMQFVQKNTNNKATIFDLPEIIPIAKKYVANANLSNQFTFISGDYNHDTFPSGYDLTFLSAIIHINSPQENQLLIKKCYDALNPNGLIVIQDHVMNPQRTQPYAGAMFAINMLVGTENGDTYTQQEITDWFTQAGFNSTKRVNTSNNALMIARK
ncbi:MAG: methyltransferase [Bacteroidota bacterium]